MSGIISYIFQASILDDLYIYQSIKFICISFQQKHFKVLYINII